MNLGGLLSDFSFLVQAAFPSAGRWLAPVFRWRYRRLAVQYDTRIIAGTLGYDGAMRAALDRHGPVPRWCGDIAAGTGAATRLIRTRFPGARVVAVDISGDMLRSLQPAPEIGRIVGSVWALPLASGTLDLVVSMNAPTSFLELARVTRPGGDVLFSLAAIGPVPTFLRRWLLRRAVPPELIPQGETAAGMGVTWSFRKLR